VIEEEVRKVRPFKVIKLKNKKTGHRQLYKLYKDEDLKFLQATYSDKSFVIDFNMDKLELEYDYDTDEEQMHSAKEMLVNENLSAIEFCVKEDPLLLVGNLNNE
jgi:hypothetical protein